MLNAIQIKKLCSTAQNQFRRFIGFIAQVFYQNSLYAILLGLPGLGLSIERILTYYTLDSSLRTRELFFSWARNYAFPTQRYQIIGYVIAVIVGYLIFLVNSQSLKKESNHKALIWVSIGASLALDVAPKFGSITFLTFAISVWFFLLIINLEIKLFNTNIFYLTVKKIINNKNFYIALTGFAFCSFVYINSPFIQNKFIIYNDNLDLIPYGEISKSVATRDKNNKNLYTEIPCDEFHNLGKVNSYNGLQDRIRNTKFYLKLNTSELCFYGSLGKHDFKTIVQFLPNFSEDKFNEVLERNKKYQDSRDSNVQGDVLKHPFEMNKTYEQFENIFHHHFQFLGPLNKYRILQDPRRIDSLYGLSYLPINFVLDNFIGFTYESFIAFFFSINVLYLLVSILLVSRIFQIPKYVATLTLVMTGSLYSLGYVTYFTGLGYGSFRHFFDFLVFYSAFQYFNKGKNLNLALAFVFINLGLPLNIEFTVFLLLALNATLLIKIILTGSNFWEKIVLFFGNAISIFTIYLIKSSSGNNPYAGNFMSGMWGFPIDGWRIYICIAVFVALFAYSLRKSSVDRSVVSIYMPLYLLIYSAMLTVYWMLVPNYGHFYAVLPYFILTLLAYLYFDCQAKFLYRMKGWTINFALLASLIFFINSFVSFEKSKHMVDVLNKQENIYIWDFENTKIRSTINPTYFKDAVKLIHKYSTPGGGIYIISPFDNILYWLSNTYSKMPSSDMLAYLTMPIDIERATNALSSDLPKYLFVGSCIQCQNTFESIDFEKYGIQTVFVKTRMERLNNLESIFINFTDRYQLLEAGDLISVYQRKN